MCLATIALGKYPFPTTSGYWGVVQAIQDSPPPEVSGFSPSLQSFLNVCLEKDPKKRLSATELLQHKFLLKYANSPLAAEAAPQVDARKRKTLKSLAQTVMDFHCDIALSSHANVNTSEGQSLSQRAGLEGFVPEMTEARLRNLAGQLGMPIDVLLEVFGEEAKKARVHLGGGRPRSLVIKPTLKLSKPISRAQSATLVPVKTSKLPTKLKRGKSEGERSVSSPETTSGVAMMKKCSSLEKNMQIALGGGNNSKATG